MRMLLLLWPLGAALVFLFLAVVLWLLLTVVDNYLKYLREWPERSMVIEKLRQEELKTKILSEQLLNEKIRAAFVPLKEKDREKK